MKISIRTVKSVFVFLLVIKKLKMYGGGSYVLKFSTDKLHLKQQTFKFYLFQLNIKFSVMIIQGLKLERFLGLPALNSGIKPSSKHNHSCSHSSRGCS